MTAAANMATLRHQIADRYLDVPLSFHREHTTGTLLAHADNDVMVASEVINPLPFSTGLMLLIVFSIVALFAIDPLLTLVGLVLFPAMFALNRFYTRRVELPAQTVQERVGDVSAITHESFEGVVVVKTLGRQDAEVERLGHAADQLRVARVRVGALRALFEPTLDALPNLGIIALLAVGGWRVSTGAVSPGDLVQAMALVHAARVPDASRRFPARGDAAFGRRARSHRRCARGGAGGRARGSAWRCRAAGSTSMPTGSSTATSPGCPVLQDCDVRIAAGEVVALVGPTGCGKTTLCELLAGLDRPERGAVRVGGIDLTEATRADLRSSVALVFQESFLFTDTIANNIAIGRDPSDPHGNDASMRWAAGIAQVARFVDSLPAGYGTEIGERGVTVSGGQRQRIALARALIRRPAVPAPRRRDVGGRRDGGGADPARSARRARHDHADRRAPGLDDRARRPRAVHAGRSHRRDRNAQRAPRDQPRLRGHGARLRPRGGVMTRTGDKTVHGAAHDVVADSAPAQARDEFTERVFAAFEDDDVTPAGSTAAGALSVLRRGLTASPELRVGLKATIVFAIVAALGKARDPDPDPGHPRPGRARCETGSSAEFVLLTCLVAVVITIGVLFVSRTAYFRLVRAGGAGAVQPARSGCSITSTG